MNINSNPRMTNYVSTTKDENNAVRIIAELKQQQTLTVHGVLCKYMECNIIKQQSQFIEILFQDHLYIITEMIEWMLTPKLIAKKKKIKTNLDFFPFRCKELMKDNIPFYQQLYLFARSNKLPISVWFNFLKKEYYDKETIFTALGYFAEVMIPFAKYEFSASTNLNQSVQLNSSFEKVQILSIMKILPKQLIEEIIKNCHYEPIFQFIKTAILVSIQDPQDYQISKTTLLKILQNAQCPSLFQKMTSILTQITQQFQQHIDLLQNISFCLKELVANIQPGNDMQLRIQSMIIIILESKTIPYAINQILQSRFCGQQGLVRQEVQSLNLSNSAEYSVHNGVLNATTLNMVRAISSSSPKNVCNVITDPDQEDLMEILLRILTYSAEIFVKIPKTIPVIKKMTDQIDFKQTRQVNYRLLIGAFRQQMQYLLTSMETMTRIVYTEGQIGSGSKSIPFSSGQKIKPVTMMKFQYLQLLQKCLAMIQYKDGTESLEKAGQLKSPTLKKLNSVTFAPFEINFDKLYFIAIIEKYLNENRWNNIVHHLLEKICHALIVCSYEYLRKNIQKDKNKKLTQTFLAFLIQNFTQRDYIFLNTFKFTTQGNLHSIYKISRDLAYTLNSTNQLVILLNDFEPWKKFIMNDLKLYEQKTYPNATKPEDQDEKDQQTTYNQVSGLKVDQADTIKKLIQNISKTKKWPTKIYKPKGNSKSGIIIANTRNSDQYFEAQDLTSMTKSHGFYLRNKKQPSKKSLNDLVRKRIEQSIEVDAQNEHIFNEIAQDSKDFNKQKQHESKSMLSKRNNDDVQKQTFYVFKNYATGTFEKKNSQKPQ